MEMEDTISKIQTLAEALTANRAEQKSLRSQLDWLKAAEEELKTSILNLMGPAKTVNLDGVGRLTQTSKRRYEIRNIESLAYKMLELMVHNGRNGLPLSEGLLLQQRVSKTAIDEIIDAEGLDDNARSQYIASAGLVEVVEPNLSFTKK